MCGPLGLITTLGLRFVRPGVPGPPGNGGCGMKCWLAPGGPDPPWCNALLCGGCPALPSPLALMSLTFVVEELGVGALELFGERASPPVRFDPDCGEAVPDVESFFFEVLESFARANCSCYIHGQRSISQCSDRAGSLV